jgi:flagellar hook-length control protein FliK
MSSLITAAPATTQQSRPTEPATTTTQPIVESAALATAQNPPTPAAPPPSAAAAPPPASPVAQVAPALVSLGNTSDGTQHITMRLQPPELGQVQIRIERPADAPARVEITVERSETLTLLLRDQPQLQRALD